MRSLFVAIPAALLLAASAGAQTAQPKLDTSDDMSTVQVPAPTFHIWDYQAEAVSGAYEMSNGWRLKVGPSSDGIVARIDKEKPIKLVALSPEKFASRDGSTTMEFFRGTRGDDMLMSYVPKDGLAQVIVVSAKMAQR